MAALLSCEMGNPDKLAQVLAETREMGIEIRPPSVNESIARFRPVKGAILFGMEGVKNVGGGAVETLVAEREANGPYKGLIDFCQRIDSREVNRKTLESLIQCGAFDFTHIVRSRLFNGIETALGRAAETAHDRASGQTSMFDLMGGGEQKSDSDDDLPEAKPWHESEMLAAEKELIGFYISGHPLAEHEWTLDTFALQRIGKLDDIEDETMIRVGGLVDKYKKVFTKKDPPRPYARFCLEGIEGALNVVVWPDDFQRLESLLEDGAAVMIGGKLVHDFRDELEIQVAEMIPLDEANQRFAQRLGLHLTEAAVSEAHLQAIREIVALHPGTTPMTICVLLDSGEKVFVKTHRETYVSATRELAQELEHLLGEDSVYVAANPKPLLREPAKRKWQKRRG